MRKKQKKVVYKLVNKNNNKKSGYTAYRPYISKEEAHGLPYEVARNLTENQRVRYSEIAHNYAKGLHILGLSLVAIDNLDKSVSKRAEAIYGILGNKEAANLGIDFLPKAEDKKMQYKIINISNHLSQAIEVGFNKMLERLDIPNLKVSFDMVKKAGKAVRTRNATLTYNGNSIREYITYEASKLKDEDTLTEEENKLRKIILDEAYKDLQKYNNIKSIPFGLLRYKRGIQLNAELEIVRPDIEAKYNLKRILGVEKYNIANIKSLSLEKATLIEGQLIELIKKTAQKEIMDTIGEQVKAMPKNILKKDLKAASKLSNVSNVTSRWLILDVVENIQEQTQFVEKVINDPYYYWTDEEKRLFLQIEMQALTDQDKETTSRYINEMRMILNGKYCNLKLLEPFIEERSCPIVLSGLSDKELTQAELENINEIFKNREKEKDKVD